MKIFKEAEVTETWVDNCAHTGIGVEMSNQDLKTRGIIFSCIQAPQRAFVSLKELTCNMVQRELYPMV